MLLVVVVLCKVGCQLFEEKPVDQCCFAIKEGKIEAFSYEINEYWYKLRESNYK
jgi:hypothetical protein